MKTVLYLLVCLPLLGCAQSQFPPMKHRDSVLHYVLRGEWVKLPMQKNQSYADVYAAFPKRIIVRGDTLDRQLWDCDSAWPLWNGWPLDKDKKELLFRTDGTMSISCPAIRYVRRDDQPITISYGQWRRLTQRVIDLEVQALDYRRRR